MTKTIVTVLVAAFLAPAVALADNYNDRYGEIRFGKLPLRGMVSHNVWVGSWWAYKTNGIAYRQKTSSTDYSDQ